jgi:predicted MPP superfamily phosphohydrolase
VSEPDPAEIIEATARVQAQNITRRTFLRRARRTFVATAAGTFLYTWRVEPHWIEVVRRGLPIVGLPTDLVGKRLVQISDLHAGPVVDQDYLLGAMESLADLQPDLLVLTGDFMTCIGDEEVAKAMEVIRAVPLAPLGRLAILGNHDYGQWWQHEEAANKLANGLERLDVRVLRNEVSDIGGLQILGVDDLWTPRFDLSKALSELATDRPAVALCHNPDGVDRPEWEGFQGWTLAGHTHGGQCKPPLLRPPINPVNNKRYVAGEYEIAAGRRLYINRGLGYLQRVRFNARPEITVFTLEQA